MEAGRNNQIFEGFKINYEFPLGKEPSLKRKGMQSTIQSMKTSKKESRMPRCSSPLPPPPPPTTTTETTQDDHCKNSSPTPSVYKCESYKKFEARLEKPLRKKCHRGKQPADTSIVSSHIVVEKKVKPDLDYTYVMTFPKSFHLDEFEVQENLACTSQNWERCFIVEQVVYYVPYVYHVPHYYTEPMYYHYNYNPYYYHHPY